jgi:ADP-heptose:LPS heptosyltransferase
MANLLFIHPGALGDVLLCLSALLSLRSSLGPGQTVFAGRPDIGGFLVHAGVCSAHHSFDAFMFSWFYSPELDISPELHRFLKGFDACLLFLKTDEHEIKKKTGPFFKKGIYIQPSIPPANFPGHAVDYHLALFRDTDVTPKRALPELKIPAHGLDLPQRYFVIHPGSGSAEKNMALSGFIEIARTKSRELDAVPLFLLGPAEDSEEFRRLKADHYTLDNLTLAQAASVIKGALCYYGNDSGITHLAAILGVPVYAYYKKENIKMWGPVGDRVGFI